MTSSTETGTCGYPFGGEMSSYIEQRMAEIRADKSLTMEPPKPRKAAPLSAPEAGYIYFVRMGAFVKIGFTTDVAARMKAIQTSSPEKIVLLRIERGAVENERTFHRRFHRYRANGEWFTLQGGLATFLKDCTEPIAVPAAIVRQNFFDRLYGISE
jgi:hypothetical protein